MKKAIRILHGIIVLVLFLIIILVVAAGVPSIGDYQLLTVLSGSMQPAIRVGSIVVVNPAESYHQGDIITFAPVQGATPTTHRIHEIKEVDGETVYITKGDANQSPDNREITQADIEGKVLFSVPYLGYLVNFARTPRGFLLVVILPAVLVIFNEIWVIKSEIEKKYEKKLAEALKDKDLRNKTKLTSIIYFLGLVGLSGLIYFSGATVAYFSDSVTVTGNTFSVGTWAEPGVVINEVYYNVGDCGDQEQNYWIELYNQSDEEVSLKDWRLTNSKDEDRQINSNTTIPGNGYVLLSHDNSTWSLCWERLHQEKIVIRLGKPLGWLNINDSLTLYNSDGIEVDFVGWGDGELDAEVGESIGRDENGDWRVYENPTPGEQNTEENTTNQANIQPESILLDEIIQVEEAGDESDENLDEIEEIKSYDDEEGVDGEEEINEEDGVQEDQNDEEEQEYIDEEEGEEENNDEDEDEGEDGEQEDE